MMRFIAMIAALLGLLGADRASAQIVPAEPTPPIGFPTLPIRIDMGRGPWFPGTFVCGVEDRNEWYGWFDGMVRDGVSPRRSDAWLCDFIEGYDATFVVAVEPDTGTYQVRMTFGDLDRPRGPARVLSGDKVLASVRATEKSESTTVTFVTKPVNGRLEMRVAAEGCRGFALNGVEISGEKLSWLDRLFPDAVQYPPMPAPETLPKVGPADRRKLLKVLCEYLVKASPTEGCFSYHGAWYQNAYPIRTLLAGARLLEEPRYAEKAYRCLDRFAERQAPHGNWLSSYFGPTGCDSPTAADSATSNLADVGTMTMCLSAAAPGAAPERRERYLRAARLYADSVSLPNQLSDGSFPNRLWGGQDFSHPYTVATATQCASLAALYLATGDARYLKAAETGIRWITWGTFLEDGRLVLHPYNQETLVVKESTHFGEVFYVAEALLWVRRATADETLKQEIDAVLDRWLFGTEGAHRKTVHGYWWPPMDAWNSSKMGGMLYILADHPRRSADPVLSEWLVRALGWLTDPDRAQSIGVTAPPASPRGNYALVATGFAGIGVASSIDGDVLYPSTKPVGGTTRR
jgi:hypothetical protein